jgi:PhnB protein
METIPNYVPGQFKTVNVMLYVKNAAKAIEFYNRAFGAEEVFRLTDPDGVIVHSEIKIEESIIMIAEENTEYGASPETLGGVTSVIQVYTGDVEAFFEDALKAGAMTVFPIKVQFYGDRSGRLRDPFGHHWIISTHMENVTAAEMVNRFHALYS